MNIKLDERLCEKYPQIFADRHADMRKTAMCWGFDCDDGWFDIIDELCEEIMQVCGDERVPVATQVKEKFGRLCFYIYGGNDAVHKAISKAEKKSSVTCEKCSKEGTLRGTSWVKTLCDKDTKSYEF